MIVVAVLLCGHSCNALEIAVEGGGFGKAEHVGCFLKRRCGAYLNESFGLRCHILLYPFAWGETASSSANDFVEIFGGKIELGGVVLHLSRLSIVVYHQIAESAVNLRIAVLCPLFVLFVAVAIEELIAYRQLRQ